MERNLNALVTGGAGFIGSHLVDDLMLHGFDVNILDNLSKGDMENIEHWLKKPKFNFIKGDLLNPRDTIKALKDCETVFHLAADPEVQTSSTTPHVHYQQNVAATYNLLEAIRKTRNVETLVFTSSSTVYGEATKIPTPENYAPLSPISIHGACKLACEALIIAYAQTYGFRSIIYRLANIIGSRSKHGVTHDLILKLRKNPKELEILGDGTQTKSYLHVSDCTTAMMVGLEKSKKRVQIYNIGSEDQVNVKTIAKIVTAEMGLKRVKLKFTGGVDGGRGWKGDVKNMLLDVNKLKSIGWKPLHNSAKAVKKATNELIKDLKTTTTQ